MPMDKRTTWKKRGPLIAAASAAAALCVALTLVVVASVAKPSLYIRGAEIKIMPDRSAQLLVNVSIEHVEMSGGAQLELGYNSRYLTPSSITDNTSITENMNTSEFFRVDEELYGGEDPFYPYQETATDNAYGGYVDATKQQVRLNLTPKAGESELAEAGHVGVGQTDSESATEDTFNLYIKAAKEVKLVQMSFRIVDTSLIPEIIEEFDGKELKDGTISGSGNFLLKLVVELFTPTLPSWEVDDGIITQKRPPAFGSNVDTLVTWNFEEGLIDAYSAKDKVTINAYQAFTDGTPGDIPAALIKYSPIVRGTYTDGHQEDFILSWGADEGCFVTDNSTGTEYLFKQKTDGSCDVFTKDDITGEFTTPVTAPWYDPTKGDYTVRQLLKYQAGGEEKIYPNPIEVRLVVTPITVTGVTAEDLEKTYVNDENLPGTYTALELPGQAQLTTDVMPGNVSLTMPIDTWQPDEAAAGTDLSKLTGTGPGGTTSVTWTDTADNNNVGEYPFTGPVYDKVTIQAVYPWLTVGDDTYPLNAKRKIVANMDDITDAREFEIITGATDDDGLLTLQIMKKSPEGGYTDMVADTAFRVKLPGGQIIDDTWFTGNGGTNQNVFASISGTMGYSLLRKAGTSGGDTAKQDLLRQAINLGGYFSVAVTEPGKAESEFITRYVPPRNNYYLHNYIGGDAFDFTGAKAGLYPFYKTSILPAFVTLPMGYTVETTYDGNTGLEPGALGAFRVDESWKKVNPTGGSWMNGTGWTPTAAGDTVVVTYGDDPFAMSTQYTGYGEVKNHSTAAEEKRVEMKVQVQEGELLLGSVRLTYEGTGDSVTTTDDGQAKRVVFDTQQAGYIYRQSVELTLTNTGDTDIWGIYIDSSNPDFIITDQPAAFLPAGAQTTFTVTYRLGLSEGMHQALDPTPIYIYSDSGVLKTFEAQFRVTSEPVWRVTVEVNDSAMGDAYPVVGAAGDPPALDGSAASYTYLAGEMVWIYAEPEDEYKVLKVYLDGEDGSPLSEYTPVVTTGDNKLYSFPMPARNVTVHVVFEEPLSAKLRLKDLQDWSGANGTGLTHQLPLYQDDYTVIREPAHYDEHGALLDTAPQLNEERYFVVIPYEADRSQIKLDFRDVIFTDKVPVGVKIVLDYDQSPKVYDYAPKVPDSAADLHHESSEFDSPLPGQTVTATITISSGDVERVYYLRIIRRDLEENISYPLNPGNSPYGMIMWDDGITDKDAAKAAFVDNMGTADRFAAGYTPAKAAGLPLTYWTEAWDATNYDRVDEALFVFAGEAFEDFGPMHGSVTNTAGDLVALTDIRRSVEVVLLDTGAASGADAFAGTDTVELTMGTAAQAGISAEAWTDGNGTVYPVRPGIYRLKYTFTDFDGINEVNFYRPLIVLTRNGDVNADRAADGADVDAVQNRVSLPLGYESAAYTDGMLFRYRVCDANNDRNINNIDANTIAAGALDQFYLPVDYK